MTEEDDSIQKKKRRRVISENICEQACNYNLKNEHDEIKHYSCRGFINVE